MLHGSHVPAKRFHARWKEARIVVLAVGLPTVRKWQHIMILVKQLTNVTWYSISRSGILIWKCWNYYYFLHYFTFYGLTYSVSIRYFNVTRSRYSD
jgi:hypothetical protein